MTAWMDHVKRTMALHPGKPLRKVLKLASNTYDKGKSVVRRGLALRKTRRRTHKRRKHKKRKHKRKHKTKKRSRRRRRRRRRR